MTSLRNRRRVQRPVSAACDSGTVRILLANTGHPATIKGGAEAATLDLAHGLRARGHDVALAVHGPGPDLVESEEAGVRIYTLPNRNLYFGFDGLHRPAALRLAWHAMDSANPLMARAFGRVLDRERPDILNTHVLVGLSQLVWREAARRGIPIVHYLHEYGSMCPRGSAFRDGALCRTPCLPCRALGFPRRQLSRLVDTVVGVSRFTLERHLGWDLFPNARTDVIPNVFRALPTPTLRRRAGGTGLLRFGYFGRIIPDKGLHLLLDALRRLPSGGWTLDVAGTGEAAYEERCRREAPEGVRFLGWSAPEPFFSAIDVMVLPSLWPDPQPRVTFESYGHGVPVIGSDAGGIPEEIDEERTGWLFRAGSTESLASLLSRRLADRADLGVTPDAFADRLAALRPESVLPRYERVYEAAISRSRPRS